MDVILTTYDKISDVLLGQPIVKEVVDKFKIKQKQLEEEQMNFKGNEKKIEKERG